MQEKGDTVKRFLERIAEEPIVCSGAVGTMLAERGFEISDCKGKWVLEHPEDLEWLTKQYLDAGCEIIGAGGSQSCRWKLEKWGLQDKVTEINYKVTRIVKGVASADTIVVGTILPSGKMLQPLGDLDPDALYDAYKEEVLGYFEGGVDVIWIMTMMDLEEAVIAVKAAKDFSDLPVMASMSFDLTPNGARTIMGVDPVSAAKRLVEAGADVVGHNCGGATPGEATLVIREMKNVTDTPLVSKPNGGKPEINEGKTSWPFTPEQFAEEAVNWVDAGARIVGGCCGTTPKHAAKIVEAVKNIKSHL
jgi:5-methyltetrahydrofolate--homocysteine methyltransferase